VTEFVPVTVQRLLAVAERLPGDPQVDDYGIIIAAVARHEAVAMGTEVYGSIRLKAAALAELLIRLNALEAHNDRFAWTAALTLCEMNGIRVSPKPEVLAELTHAVRSYDAGVREIAQALRDWSRLN
jgi:prophage maintenance system killer protein